MDKEWLEQNINRIRAICKPNKSVEQARLSGMLERSYSGKWAVLKISRNKAKITISWTFDDDIKDPNRFEIRGGIREITIVPDPSYEIDEWICDGTGNGSIELALEEGSSYQFIFYFQDLDGMDECDRLQQAGKKYDIDNSWDMIEAHVAIPLSDERRALLRKAVSLENDPEKQIHDKAEMILNMENAFNTARKNGIKRIKEEGLSPEEKKNQIERFIDQLERMKEEFGL